MSDDRGEARGEPPSKDEGEPSTKPTGIPESQSSARVRTPKPEGEQPIGLTMTPSARLRLQLVLEHDEAESGKKEPSDEQAGNEQASKKRVSIAPEPVDPKRPPNLAERSKPPSTFIPFEGAEIRLMRSVSRWIAFSGLMTLTVGALTGLSYATGTGTVAHVVVGILASAFAVWLLAAAFAFHRSAGARKGRQARAHLVSGFGLLRSALLLKTVLLFSAMALGCFTFSLAISFLFAL